MRDREGVLQAPFYTIVGGEHKGWRGQERTATEDTTQSVLWSRCCLRLYIHSCSQLSASATGRGLLQHTFTLEKVTGWCCLFLR